MSAPPTNGHPAFAGGPLAPPQNLEAEQSVLGAVLLSDTALPALIIDERLQAEDFYRRRGYEETSEDLLSRPLAHR